MSFPKIKTSITGTVHFIGIGGIGMSALAFILDEIGIKVQGSDNAENYLTPKFRQRNIPYFLGQKKENITSEVGLVVKTSIIADSNPEIIAAKEKSIKIITRAELLAMLMAEKKSISIAGTHGKTSTTAMTAMIFEAANLDPTIINGGVIHYFGSNEKLGQGEYLITESDESDGSFVILPSLYGAVTNIEPEHLDWYDNDFEKQKSYFEKYITQITDNNSNQGFLAICLDDEQAEKMYHKLSASRKNIVSYSIEKDADLVAKNINFSAEGLFFDAVFTRTNKTIANIFMPIFGIHNIKNSLAAIAIADHVGIDEKAIKEGLKKNTGVKRRFTKIGEANGVTIIDDYAHHPTEIRATLATARSVAKNNKVIAVLQAHKYRRVRDLFKEFCNAFSDADLVIVDDIYSVAENPIEGINQDSLIAGIVKNSNQNVIKLEQKADLAKIVKTNSKNGDLVICMGAGNITYMAQDLPKQLQELV